MIQNLIIFLFLISPFYGYSSSSNGSNGIVTNINSKTFCKLAVKEECSQRNAPHAFQCGRSVCSSNRTECSEYLRAEKKLKDNQMRAIIDITAMSRLRNYNEIKLQTNFKIFQSKIKNCSQTAYKWKPSDVCVRQRECFLKNSKFVRMEIHYEVFKINCPCSKSKPYACGSPKNYCSISRDACDSFSLMKKNKNSSALNQSHAIQKCNVR